MSIDIVSIINNVMLSVIVPSCYTYSIMDSKNNKVVSGLKYFLYGSAIITFYCWYSRLIDNHPTDITLPILSIFSVLAYYGFVGVILILLSNIEAILNRIQK